MSEYASSLEELFQKYQNVQSGLEQLFFPESIALTKRQYMILLYILNASDKHVTVSGIVTANKESKSRVSQTLKRLEELQVIKRTANRCNRREVWVVLTQKGIELKQRMEETKQYLLEEMKQHIDEEELLHALRITASMEKAIDKKITNDQEMERF